MREFQLSEALRLRAQSEGETGLRWLGSLAAHVSSLEADWNIQVAESHLGGSESLVLSATRADGTPAILKIGLPGTADLATEARVYRIAHGRGYARLFAHDALRNALLLERLGAPLGQLGLAVPTQLEMICATLREAWVSLDRPHGLMTGAEKARWLMQFIAETWSALDEPCDASIVELALAFAAAREAAHDPAQCVLVHGDCHEMNTLLCADAGTGAAPRCKFVDPDGLFAEPAYDLGILMRGWSDELLGGDALELGRARCTQLASLTGIDAQPIWQWGFVERVSTALVLIKIGMHDEAHDMLAVAARWAAAGQQGGC